MRYGGIISAVLLVWLLIGVLALYQRGGFDSDISLQTALNVALTVLAGPLNYAGVKPEIAVPQPSSMPAFGMKTFFTGALS
jgi:hypothetical protein